MLLVIPLFLASHWDARNRGMTRSMMMTADSRWHHSIRAVCEVITGSW